MAENTGNLSILALFNYIRFLKKIGCPVQSADLSSGSLSGPDRRTGKPKVSLVASLQESNGI